MVLSPSRLAPPVALWAIPVSDLAGVARHALDVARAGIPGWRLVFLVPPGDLPRELRALGAAVLEQPFGPDHGLRASLGTLRHVVRTLRPQVLHTHLAYADVVAAMPLGKHQPYLLTTEHGIARDDLVYHQSAAKMRVMEAVHAARLRRFDAAIAVSEATAEAMREKWRVRGSIAVIPNGVSRQDLSRLDPSRRPRAAGLRILSLARLAPEKRLDRLVEAFALLVEKHPEATLTLAGKGELEADLRAQVQRLGLGEKVTFPGYIDARAAMAEHDVLAMLSVWENSSYALLDAATAGLGVVASAVGGNPEILPAHCLVDPDVAETVAGALATQGLDPGARPSLDDWPTVEQMCERIAEVYGSLENLP